MTNFSLACTTWSNLLCEKVFFLIERTTGFMSRPKSPGKQELLLVFFPFSIMFYCGMDPVVL